MLSVREITLKNMALQFTQKEIEQIVAEILEHGDITKISNITGIGYSYVDQQLNPNDERKSYIVGALEILCALDEVDPERGETLFQKFTAFRDCSKKHDPALQCLTESTVSVNREAADVVNSNLSGLSLYEQLSETIESESAIKQHKENLLAAINKEKESLNGSRLRVAK